jgi:hypothetical protein
MLMAMKEAISPQSPLSETPEELSKRLGSEAVTEALNCVLAEEESLLDPVLATLQAAAIPRDDW